MRGRVRDGHGDVHLDSVCVTEPIRIFDCIEFNERFRYQDVAEEVAFLAMDLEFEGFEELAGVFVEAYVEVSGDDELRELLDFYRAYRAYVRAKVSSFATDDPIFRPTRGSGGVHGPATTTGGALRPPIQPAAPGDDVRPDRYRQEHRGAHAGRALRR